MRKEIENWWKQARADYKTAKIVKTFAKIINKSIPSCKVILFGSRAKGTAKKSSDYDFLLVSPKFREWEWEERSARAYFLKRNIPGSMDIICLTPKEFAQKKNQLGLIQQIAEEGLVVSG